jgi:hypothetical protein
MRFGAEAARTVTTMQGRAVAVACGWRNSVWRSERSLRRDHRDWRVGFGQARRSIFTQSEVHIFSSKNRNQILRTVSALIGS